MFIPKKLQAVSSSLEFQKQSHIQFLSEILSSFNEFSTSNSEVCLNSESTLTI